MDLFISKKNNHALSQWSVRCYRLRHCELTQYKKGIDDFKLCKPETIKQRHNLYDIEEISLNPKAPYVLKITIPTKYQRTDNFVFLKFSDVNANVHKSKPNEKDRNHALFMALYRFMASSSKTSSQCLERPLPTNLCVALYYLLQKLYTHADTLKTKFIFNKKALEEDSPDPKRAKFIEKLYYDLIVNSHRFVSVDDHYELTPDLLSIAVLYTLDNMPTSLFCDCYCKKLTEFIAQTMGDDRDVSALENSNRIGPIKAYLLQKYSARKMEFRKTNGFHLFNRYGFMTIIFTLLHHIQSKKCISATEMNSRDLAVMFAPCLQSKRYRYICRSEEISKNARYDKKTRRDKEYEKEFITMVEVLIRYAPQLFPGLKRVPWKVQSLIHCQGQEKVLIRYYNDQYSKHTKNEYYFPSILKKGTNHGNFDGTLHRDARQRSLHEGDSSSTASNSSDEKDKANDKKYIVRVGPQPYHLKKQPSYHEHAVYHSDIGASDLSDVMEEDVKDETTQEDDKEEEEEEYKEHHKHKHHKHKKKPQMEDDYLQTERSYDADVGDDDEEEEDVVHVDVVDDTQEMESDMKYPDLAHKKKQVKQAVNALKPTPRPHVITHSDIGYTSDDHEEQYQDPPIFDGEPISEQDLLSDSSEYKEPQPKQVQTNRHMNDRYDHDTYDVAVGQEPFLDQCEACVVVPLMRLFGYTDNDDTKRSTGQRYI